MLGCCTRIPTFRVWFPGREGSGPRAEPSSTLAECVSPCASLCEDPSAFQQRPSALSPHQVSFCWRSLGCWKRRKWQRKRRASTAASLMWCSAQRTCSGECRPSPNLMIAPGATHAWGGTDHDSFFCGGPEFSMAEEKIPVLPHLQWFGHQPHQWLGGNQGNYLGGRLGWAGCRIGK